MVLSRELKVGVQGGDEEGWGELETPLPVRQDI